MKIIPEFTRTQLHSKNIYTEIPGGSFLFDLEIFAVDEVLLGTIGIEG